MLTSAAPAVLDIKQGRARALPAAGGVQVWALPE
jgi:hypothetical protein